MFSHSVACDGVCMTVSFAMQKLFRFARTHLLIVDLSACSIVVLFRKSSPVSMSSRYSPLSLLWDSVHLVIC